MNLREIDRLVAEKVMGWKPQPFPEESTNDWGSGWDKIEWPWTRKSDCAEDAIEAYFPTEDIAAAWEVVEKLTRECSLTFWSLKENGGWAGEARGDGLHEANADTMPLLICDLALRAKGVEIPKS